MRRLRAARELGISFKRFGGWEPRQVTSYEHDDAGRLVRSITTTEIEWDADEVEWMLALSIHESSLCGRCGASLVESTDPAHDPDNPDGTHRYIADDPTTCFHCVVLQRAEAGAAKGDESGYHRANFYTARLVARPPRAPGRRRGQVKRADSGDTANAAGQ